jgi:non-specific serine/threonine protein kinase/serine/threonine-protein kinase
MSGAIDPERWSRVNELFHRAIDHDRHARVAFLTAACAGDAALLAEVERLVVAHEASGDFFTEAMREDAARLLNADHLSPVGRQLGAYKLTRELGRGGMGAVYLAERADDHFQKRVAVKLIKRGMDTEAALRQFGHERQILAGLEHPNIAHLLDAGTTGDGLPFFIMEYIDGQSIDRYSLERHLSVSERLQLFLQVCAAVTYAHQHLVVHRDLKPSNILVTPEGVPKLLDFGIAKLVEAGNPSETVGTIGGAHPMTPEYASPEQLEGRAATTLSDVYSLGVLLYELLTGRPPFRFSSRSPADVAHARAAGDPPRPSDVVEPAQRHRLRGDLDTIALMALRHDRQRRYQSVEQLSLDIRRHLDGMPVTARQDTLGYRASKFVRRHKVAVASGVLLMVSMTAGLVGTLWQARRARAQQARAEKRFQDVRTLAHAVVFDYHDAIRNLPGSTAVRERLVKDALGYLDSLAGEAGDDVALLRELGLSYQRLADVQGWPGGSNLGDTRGAVKSYEQSIKMLGTLAALTPDVVEDRTALAVTHDHLGQALWQLGDLRGSLEHRKSGLELMEQLGGAHPTDRTVQFAIAGFITSFGQALEEQGDVAGALEQHLRAKQRLESLLAGDPAHVQTRLQLARVQGELGSVYGRRGEHETSLRYIRAQLEILTDLAKKSPENAAYRGRVGAATLYEGDALGKMGRPQDALESYQRYLASSEELARADPRNVQYLRGQALALVRISDSLLALGRAGEAIAALKRALPFRVADVQAEPGNVSSRVGLIRARAKLAKALALTEGSTAALTEGEAASALMDRYPAESVNPDLLGIYSDVYIELGDMHAALASHRSTAAAARPNRWRTARRMYQRSLDILRDLQRRHLLDAEDEGKLDTLAAHIARCDAMLKT